MSGRQTGLTTAFQVTTITALICLALTIMGVNLFLEAGQFTSRVDQMRRGFIQQQKNLVKREVLQVVDLIEEERSGIAREGQRQVKQRTYEAFSVAQHFYQKYAGVKSTEEILTLIIEALRPLRFGYADSGYFFMTRLDGIELLFADRPQLEGKNLLDAQDSEGRHIIKDMIDITRRQGEGFYEYLWSKPGSLGNNHKKVSYIKYFAPLNCFIGTGVYYADIDEQIRGRLLTTISKIRFESDGYIFVNSLDGDCLVSSGKIYAGQGKLWQIFNKDPQKTRDLFRLEHHAAMTPEGDFINYSFNKPTAPDQEFPKTSFIYGLPELNWLIGAGVYLDDVEKQITDLEHELTQKRLAAIRSGIVLTLVASFVIIILFQLFSRRIKNDLHSIVEGFEQVADQGRKIDCDRIHYPELARIGDSANRVLSEKQQALDILRESETRFKDMTNLLPEAIFETDASFRMTYANRKAAELFGCSEAELTGGLTIHDLIAPQELEKLSLRTARIFSVDAGGSQEYQCVKKDGSSFPALFHSDLIRIDGKPGGLRGVIIDLSQRKQEEEELLNLRKLESIGILAGGIAHNFNNSLAAIIGSLEMARRKLDQPEKVAHYLESATKAGLRSRDLVSQILKYSRRQEQENNIIDLDQVIEETLTLVRSTLPATTELVYRPAAGLHIKADPNQIQEALLNLCNNAVQAMEEEGRLEILLDPAELRSADIPAGSETRPGAYARLRIEDNGCGIEQNLMDKIFDPFFTTKGVGEGTGMGLATVRGIVDKHGGLIKVSSAVGKGTAFDLYFPRLENIQPSAPAATTESLPHGDERILLIDDNEALVDLGRDLLTDLGYRVSTFADSRRALEHFTAQPDHFDLVISDQTMPELTGKELITAIKQLRPDIRSILITGYSSKVDEESAAQLGIDAFCMKPLNQLEFAQTVRRVLDVEG